MADTRYVEFGSFQMAVPPDSYLTDTLDTYNVDGDDFFSPHDLEYFGVSSQDSLGLAIDILAEAVSTYDTTLPRQLQSLVGVVNDTEALFREAVRLSEFHPSLERVTSQNAFLGIYQLQFSGAVWSEVQAASNMAISLGRFTNAFNNLLSVFDDELHRKYDYICPTYNYKSHNHFFDPVFADLEWKMARIRQSLHVRAENDALSRLSNGCTSVRTFQCVGPSCPEDDNIDLGTEVTIPRITFDPQP